MHELSIAMSMIEIAVEHAQSANGKKINQIEIEVGELSGVVTSALEFCFEAACKETIAEGAELNLIVIPGVGECSECHSQFPLENLYAICPKCEALGINIISGQELKLKSINVD